MDDADLDTDVVVLMMTPLTLFSMRGFRYAKSMRGGAKMTPLQKWKYTLESDNFKLFQACTDTCSAKNYFIYQFAHQ